MMRSVGTSSSASSRPSAAVLLRPLRVSKSSMSEHYKVGGTSYPPYEEYGVVENAALKYNKNKWNRDDEDGTEHQRPPTD